METSSGRKHHPQVAISRKPDALLGELVNLAGDCMDAPRCMRFQIWEGTKHPILITSIWLSSCWLIRTIQKIPNSARHIEMQWFGASHQPTLLLSQSEASSEPLDSIIKEEATVYNPRPLCRLFLPQWVAGCLQRKKDSHFYWPSLWASDFPQPSLMTSFSLTSCAHSSQKSERRDFYIKAKSTWQEARGEVVGWSRDED